VNEATLAVIAYRFNARTKCDEWHIKWHGWDKMTWEPLTHIPGEEIRRTALDMKETAAQRHRTTDHTRGRARSGAVQIVDDDSDSE